MSKKDFFIVVIKLFGLYSLVQVVFFYIPSTFETFFMDFSDPVYLVYSMVVLLLVILLMVFLLFKAEVIYKALKLGKDFDTEEIQMGNLSEKSIVMLASILFGAYLIVTDFPIFLNNTLYAVKSQNIRIPFDSKDRFFWIVGLIRVFIGLFLVTNYKLVHKLLAGKSAINQESTEH